MKNIINDIKDLRGNKVSVFGQQVVLPQEVDLLDIDIIDVCETLEQYQIDTIEIYTTCENCISGEIEEECENCQGEGCEECDNQGYYIEQCEECEGDGHILNEVKAIEGIEKLYDDGDLKEVNCGNSYNWLGPISNHFDYKIYKDINNDKIYVEFKVHRYGDVRCNYTDSVILEFSHENEFMEVLLECNRNTSVEVEGQNFDIYIDVFQGGKEVSYKEGEYLTTIYSDDIDEIKQDIKECL